MAGSDKPRVVSGDLKAGRPGVIDADYVRLPLPPDDHAETDAGSAAPRRDRGRTPQAPESIGMLRQGRSSRSRQEPAGPVFWIVGAMLVTATFWVAGGHALFRDMRLFNPPEVETLRIVNLSSRVAESGDKAALMVDGEVLNEGDAAESLPPIEIAVTGNDGLTTRYRLGTSGRPLPPGETFGFSSRLDAPKNGMKTVSVAFVK